MKGFNLAESSKPNFPPDSFLPTAGSTSFVWMNLPCTPCETLSPRYLALESNIGSTTPILAKVLPFPDIPTIEDTAMPEWSELENPPSESVRTLAKTVGRIFAGGNLNPSRIVPSADGEITYYFFVEDDPEGSPIKFASVTSTEGGELVLLMVDKARGITDATEFSTEPDSMRSVLDQLAEFIGQCPAL